ncbi:MAG TPA: DNA adenine methylase [Sedimentisphaerales bacterium]|nr:DNA adenine methylase [Sedimentisphaerales bacterium]
MKIKAIAPWAGAKRNLAPRIVELLGKHRVYWELCAGSLAVLLAKEQCRMETAVDLHGDMTNLAFVLQNEAMALDLYGRAARTLMSDELFADARSRLVAARTTERDIPDTKRAFDYLLCSWIGRNGCAGTAKYTSGFCVRYTANGGHAAKRWRSVIESIPAWHYRLLNVTILRRDIFEVAARIEDKAGTAIYCDPPYFEKGIKYLHDFEPADHVRLAESLNQFEKARVVLSYYDHPQLRELYPNWTMHKIEVAKALAHQGARGANATTATEVLLVNDRAGHQGLFE